MVVAGRDGTPHREAVEAGVDRGVRRHRQGEGATGAVGLGEAHAVGGRVVRHPSRDAFGAGAVLAAAAWAGRRVGGGQHAERHVDALVDVEAGTADGERLPTGVEAGGLRDGERSPFTGHRATVGGQRCNGCACRVVGCSCGGRGQGDQATERQGEQHDRCNSSSGHGGATYSRPVAMSGTPLTYSKVDFTLER